jgi:hypothetical protein
VEDLAQNSSPLKWHTVKDYNSKDGGHIYYLGTNSLNGIYLYWNGDVKNPQLNSLDYCGAKKVRYTDFYWK